MRERSFCFLLISIFSFGSGGLALPMFGEEFFELPCPSARISRARAERAGGGVAAYWAAVSSHAARNTQLHWEAIAASSPGLFGSSRTSAVTTAPLSFISKQVSNAREFVLRMKHCAA
jgi:hypothetical protein